MGTYLRNEFQTDRGIDRDIASNSKAYKGRDNEEGRVGVATSESDSKGRGDQAGQIKSPLTSDDVDQETPDKCAGSQTSREGDRDVSRLIA